MKIVLLFVLSTVLGSCTATAQSVVKYDVSFPNVVHHEAEISVSYNNLEKKTITLQMSRSSPGRYALHEFAKNVYNVKAIDSKGNSLEIKRPNPYQWNIDGHDGMVKLSYTLFGNRGDGTYSQFDETHAHMNIPATFMYAVGYGDRPIEVKINMPKSLAWKVATQLKNLGDNRYSAPDFQYFMDSPIEVGDFMLREYKVTSGKSEYSIRLALHHLGTAEEADEYFEQIKKVVDVEMKVFGELPNFEYNTYTFLACYMPNVSGDGMEHRNSTICTSTRSLANGGMKNNIGTIAHELFHAWNVERIRPKSLEPFNFAEVNMSGELWLAEGFTSYYTGLLMCRAGLANEKDYIRGLAGSLNYIINSPGRNYFNPIEMSFQAPFVDAANSVDPTNRDNTFISYYNYGSVLGLGLDLSLRKMDNGLNLDDYMKLLYIKYGKTEVPYSLKDLILSMDEYAGKSFTADFFTNYIYDSKVPDFELLLAAVVVEFKLADSTGLWVGATILFDDNNWLVYSGTTIDGPAYLAGLEKGDIILEVNNKPIGRKNRFVDSLKEYKIGDTIKVKFSRIGVLRETSLTIASNPAFSSTLNEDVSKPVSKKELKRRKAWLN